MSTFDVVQRPLDKAGVVFVEVRREDGHGSTELTPTYVDTGLTQPTTPTDTQSVSATTLPLPTGASTASKQLPDGHSVAVNNTVTVQDDYAVGELLDDQMGDNTVKTFTFTSQVNSFWIAVTGTTGVVKVDHYGGTPSPTRGIPVEAGGVLPIPEPATVVKAYVPIGLVVTIWGQLR